MKLVVQIGARRVTVIEDDQCKDDDGDRAHGTWDSDTGIIVINAADQRDIKDSTLLHEYLHAISDIYGLDLSEKDVRILENSLVTLGVTTGVYK